MPGTNRLQAALVLVELGAAWPASLLAREGDPRCRVLAEVEGEGPLAFAARAEAFVATAFPPGTAPAVGVVACNQRADVVAEAARRALAELLLSRLDAAGRLWFAAAEDASERFRQRIFELAAELAQAPGAAGRVQAIVGEAGGLESGPATSEAAALGKRSVAQVA